MKNIIFQLSSNTLPICSSGLNFASSEKCLSNICQQWHFDEKWCTLLYGPGHAKTCLKPYANNKGTDQPALMRSLMSTFVVHCLYSMISILAKSKDWGFWLPSVAEQSGLNLNWSQTPEDSFSLDGAHIIYGSV